MWPSGQLKILTGRTREAVVLLSLQPSAAGEKWWRCWDRTGKEKGPSREKKYHVEEGNELLTNNKKRNDGAGIYKKDILYQRNNRSVLTDRS